MPRFPANALAPQVFRSHAVRLMDLLAAYGEIADFGPALELSLQEIPSSYRTPDLRAALCILTDLARQRWSIRIGNDRGVEIRRPQEVRLDPIGEKARVRAQELVKRDEQLREPAAKKFIEGMEKRVAWRGRFVSIYSLMRDGREFAESLRKARSLPRNERSRALRESIDPYLQFVDEAERCEYTGLSLQDIWRYFRHTWSTQYTSTPGRSMGFLVRDRARECHPIIGIGALGSPIVQIYERDTWIGWHPSVFLEVARESTSAELGTWLIRTVENALSELYLEDFFEEQLLTPTDIRVPSAGVVTRLAEYAKTQRELHHRLAGSKELKRSPKCDGLEGTLAHWRERATSHLYRSKRALALADMLRSRMVLQRDMSTMTNPNEVRALVESAEGRHTIRKILRKAKADRVGIAMADITVCGSVAPYNAILGGKLVAMLAASPEVVEAYRRKYAEQESEIASSMAGRPIVRPSQLVFLGTTSLYGVGSSQYNRVRVPAERIGGISGEYLEYLELQKSKGYGTSHFSSESVDALVEMVQQSSNGQRVNSIFGEGVSPKLRKIRAGLDELNLPADELLQHGRQRILYGVSLVRNLREFLLGMEDEPRYVFNATMPHECSTEIARWWSERWLSGRIESDDVLSRVAEHTLIRPVRHGARVVMPSHDSDQGILFDDLPC
jgi:hypothetical protein